jgi:hypothetical protein
MYQAVVGELEQLARVWPEDEAVRVLLAICLYRAGRVAEAAQACREAIGTALDHGLDARSLTALQRGILNGELPETGLPYLTPVSVLT